MDGIPKSKTVEAILTDLSDDINIRRHIKSLKIDFSECEDESDRLWVVFWTVVRKSDIKAGKLRPAVNDHICRLTAFMLNHYHGINVYRE